ncbi:MAG: hypothetical protein ABIJ00_11400 [Candidatus Eisenbacteria bacterium]
MPILDAAVAFALTMLVVATLVTAIIRILQMALKSRAKGLQDMLDRYFTMEVVPVVRRETQRLHKKLRPGVAENLVKTASEFGKDDLVSEGDLDTLAEYLTEDLTESLKRSNFGATLLSELGNDAQTVFDELATRYDVVGEKWTKSFRESSRKWAVVVAVILAAAVNIDSIHIASTYIRNEGMREGVVAKLDGIVKEYEDAVESAAETQGEMSKQALIQAVSTTRAQVDLLASTGFPIGWSYFPYADLMGKPPKEFKTRNSGVSWGLWGLGIVVTAILAGLGAPFWYDTLTGISHAAQRASAARKPDSCKVVAQEPDGP